MIVNAEKFQAFLVKKNAKMKDSYPLNFNDLTLNSENSLKPFGIKIDKNMSYEKHISFLYNKANNQLNVIGRIQKLFSFKKK